MPCSRVVFGGRPGHCDSGGADDNGAPWGAGHVRVLACDGLTGVSSVRPTIGTMRYAKGHGTRNDFVVLPDPDGTLDLSPELVARLCDRRSGLGGDGVLRVVRVAAVGGLVPASDAEWFMDYRNGDGSVAEMCGNGVRVFVRYLIDRGWAAGPDVAVATRAGIKQVREHADGTLTVDMGAPVVFGAARAVVGGATCDGLRIQVGNPHLACVVDTSLDKFDLDAPPLLDPVAFPAGANVELVRVTGDHRAEVRVHERGAGVTWSCGTGAVAAAVAAAHATRQLASGAAGQPGQPPQATPAQSEQPLQATPGTLEETWQVHLPGGDLTVTLDGWASLLTGPAVIVAEGELTASWLAA